MSEPGEMSAQSELAFVQHRRIDWRHAGPLAASAALHVLLLAWLILPRVPTLSAADAPVNVDIVTPREMASLERAVSSSVPPSSSAPASSSAASSAEPSSMAGSSVEAASAAASSREAQTASSHPVPVGKPAAGRAGRLVVPVGEADSSSEAASAAESSAASEIASSASEAPPNALATASGGADDIASTEPSEEPPRPVGGGALHPAKHFYLAEMLRAPGLAQVRDTLNTMPPERRVAQTCMIEALGQAGHAGYNADAIIPNVFAPIAASGQTYSASGGAVRSDGSWYRIAYDCTLSPDMAKVTSFSFHIGADVTSEMAAQLGNH